jgi:hypothetical protein
MGRRGPKSKAEKEAEEMRRLELSPRSREVVRESEVMASLRGKDGRVQPQVISMQQAETIEQKCENVLHAVFDAMPPDKAYQQAEGLDLDRWSRIVARLDRRQQVKMDVNVSAMGILGMFPVAIEE